MIIITETRDPELLARLNEDVQNLHYQLHPEIFKPYDREGVALFQQVALQDLNARAFVALQDEVPVGCMLCFIREAKENAFHYAIRSVYVDQISVLSAYRRSGAGKMLLQRAEQLAQEMGIKRLELDHWSTNTVAATWFRKNGYSLFKERLFKTIA